MSSCAEPAALAPPPRGVTVTVSVSCSVVPGRNAGARAAFSDSTAWERDGACANNVLFGQDAWQA